ncbi:hypothetical protein ASF87_16730 [Microbacterium sp. Leaf161]|uniref:hypothetical protein n=1 Tax=Microbacterium sp. Leaf161 TaxID=1736281 RepID=UPI0006F1C9B8|nr:hypothetical protein [Microbacterium sp. Leaf161]KQR43435.1 hypothetical protein ASF87_16730 [Microbacterium sp. Leaf161]
MITSITYPGGTPIVPDITVVGSVDAEVVSRSITHEILDGPPVHTLRPSKPQTGTLRLLFTTSAKAHAAKDQLTAAAVYTISSTAGTNLPSRFVVRSVTVTQSRAVANVWTVSVDYEAVV